MPDDPRTDPRWLRLHDREWTCPSCGSKHAGLFDLSVHAPAFWRGPIEPLPNSQIRSSSNVLTHDLCVSEGEYYYVRCVLELPIIGVPEKRLAFGIWSSLSKQHFDVYVETFDSGTQGRLGPWIGLLSNELPGYPDTLNLICDLQPRDDHFRPLMKLRPFEHPLPGEQAQGITFDRVLELYALSGHDLRNALTN